MSHYTSPTSLSKHDLDTPYRSPGVPYISPRPASVDDMELREEAINKSSLLLMEMNKEQIISLKDDYDKTLASSRALEHEVKQLRHEKYGKEAENHRIASELSAALDKSRRLESDVTIMTRQLEQKTREAEAERRNLTDSLRREQTRSDGLTGEVVDMKRRERALTEEMEMQKKTIASLRDEISRQKDMIDSNERMLVASYNEADDTKRALDSASQEAAKVGDLERRLRDAEARCADRNSLQLRLVEERSANEKNQNEIQMQRKEIEEMEALQHNLADATRTLKDRLSDAEMRLEAERRRTSELEAQMAETQRDLERSRKLNDDQLEANTTLTERLEKLQQQCAELEQSLDEHRRRLNALNTEKAMIEAERSAATRAMQDSADVLRSLEASGSSSPSESSYRSSSAASPSENLARGAERARAKIEDLQRQIDVLGRELDRTRTDRERLASELERERGARLLQEERTTSLHAQADVDASKMKDISQRLDASRCDVDALRDRLAEKDVEIQKLTTDKAEAQRALARTNLLLTDSQKEVGTLRAQLGERDERLNDVYREQRKLRDEATREKGRATALETEVEVAKTTADAKEREIRRLRESEAELAGRASRLETELSTRQAEMRDLSYKVQRATSDLAMTKGERESLARLAAEKEREVERVERELKDSRINLVIERANLEREKAQRQERTKDRLSLLDVRVEVEDQISRSLQSVSPSASTIASRSPALSVLASSQSRTPYDPPVSPHSLSGSTGGPITPSAAAELVRRMDLDSLRSYVNKLDGEISSEQMRSRMSGVRE